MVVLGPGEPRMDGPYRGIQLYGSFSCLRWEIQTHRSISEEKSNDFGRRGKTRANFHILIGNSSWTISITEADLGLIPLQNSIVPPLYFLPTCCSIQNKGNDSLFFGSDDISLFLGQARNPPPHVTPRERESPQRPQESFTKLLHFFFICGFLHRP
ncbi:hypothetical protein AFLA_005830 [Aspergillus flavus NRRL3357]|nr:hypothetical protein AFLA_005830 [Aspergillus flavus NRRL3357]